MNTGDNIDSEEEKNEALTDFCKDLYYLTRGYKPSYRVTEYAGEERKNMFRRHENDFWDAALEGAGDYVLLYDNLFDSSDDEDDDKAGQKTSLFFDKVRPLEMRGDYFILFILLLYQHYSVVYFSKKIAETIPMQKETLLSDTEDSQAVYDRLRDLKLDVSMFFANRMFESIGQITDVCTIYSFIEEKLYIKKNTESLQRGISELEALCSEVRDNRRQEKEEKTNKILAVIGMLAVVSILFDGIQFIGWMTESLSAWARSVGALLSRIPVYISIPVGILIAVGLAYLIMMLIKRRKKTDNK